MPEYTIPPQNIELEESILASILLFPEEDLFELEPSDFYRTAHQKIYTVCKNLWVKTQSVDLVSTTNELIKNQQLEEIGGATYLSKLTDLPPVVDIKYSVGQIKGYANLRRMIELSNTIAKRAFEGNPDTVDEIINILQAGALKIGDQKKENSCNMQELILDCVEYCENIQENKGMTGIPSGFADLDSILCGFQDSDLYIIAGRPSMGKTAFVLNCMENAAAAGYANDFYSLEMARLQVAIRYLSMRSGVNSQKFRSGYFSQNDWVMITDAAGRLSELPINIDDSASASYLDIQKKSRKNYKKNGTRIIWIDYLKFLTGDKGLNRNLEIGTITRGLKQLAKELKVPVVLVCQLNRAVEQRGNKRPVLSDLRDSGEIEADADTVIFLYRDDYYDRDEDNPNRGIVEVQIAKQRMGPTGIIRLMWDEKTTKFNNLISDKWNV